MFILDTNVVSELRKARVGKADRNVVKWADRVDATDLYLSVISIQELEMGVLSLERRDGAQGALVRAWLEKHVLPAFADRILPLDTPVALQSAKLSAPDQRPFRDGLIAATAPVHGMTVVNRNEGDFIPTGVKIVNPWSSKRR